MEFLYIRYIYIRNYILKTNYFDLKWVFLNFNITIELKYKNLTITNIFVTEVWTEFRIQVMESKNIIIWRKSKGNQTFIDILII